MTENTMTVLSRAQGERGLGREKGFLFIGFGEAEGRYEIRAATFEVGDTRNKDKIVSQGTILARAELQADKAWLISSFTADGESTLTPFSMPVEKGGLFFVPLKRYMYSAAVTTLANLYAAKKFPYNPPTQETRFPPSPSAMFSESVEILPRVLSFQLGPKY